MAVYRQPWYQLWTNRRNQRWAFTVAGAVNVDALPTAGALVISGQQPTISAGATLTPAAGVLRITGQTATVAASHTATPGAGSVVLTGQAATVSAGALVTPASGALAVTGQAATVTVGGGATLNPAAGSLVVTGQTATVSAGSNLLPAAGALQIAGQAATFAAHVTAQPTAGALVINGQAAVWSVLIRLAPISSQAASNLKDTLTNIPPTRVADIDEPTGSDDGEWWTAVDPSLDTSARVRMDTPSGSLTGTQTLRVLVRATSTPCRNVVVEAWQNGVQLTSTTTQSVTSTTGQVVTLTLPSSEITDPTKVEVKVYSQAA